MFIDEFYEFLVNVLYGGEFCIYFNVIFFRLIMGDILYDFKCIWFYGGVIVVIVDSWNGVGYYVSF